MDLALTEEQTQVRDAARTFLEAECPPTHVRAMEADPLGYSPEVWAQLAEQGWLGLALPEAVGGFGMGFVELCLLIEEQGRAALPSPFVPTVLAARAIAAHGTEAQQEILPSVVAGERILGVARTGPRASWDPGDVGVVAAPSGGGFVLNGTAVLVAWAHAADTLLVFAERGGEPAAFLVPTDGLRMEPQETVGGDRCSRVVFEGVKVPGEALLAGRGIARVLADEGAVARCAELVGIGQQIVDMSVAWAKERVAFGRPIGTFQAIQHHCANMAVDVLSARHVSYEASWRLAEGLDAAEAVAIAKAWTSDAIARVAALGHQVHGAIGFTAEHDLHLLTRRARAAELDFGDAAWHRSRLADQLGLSLPR